MAMDLMFISKLRKPPNMDDKTFFEVWEEEARTAIAALDAGRMKFMYKVAGRYELVGFMSVEKTEQIDQIIHELPIWKSGSMHIVEDYQWFLLSDYRAWAAQLKQLAKRSSR
jgi:muconolactone delta-isomerase